MVPFALWVILFFIACSLLVNFKTAASKLGMIETEQELQKYPGYYSLILLLRRLKHIRNWEQFLEYIALHIQLYRIFFALFAAYDLFQITQLTLTLPHLWVISLCVLGVMLFIEISMRLFAIASPLYSIKLVSFFSGILLFVFFPLTYPMIIFIQFFSKKQDKKGHKTVSYRFKTKLQEFIHTLELNHALSHQERKLLMAIASFRDRVVREIMVPRIDVFTLSAKKTIQECAEEFVYQGYSRIPVFEDNVDNIIGVVLYKDILEWLLKPQSDSSAKITTIKQIVKPVLFTPETKKISNLLQEFKANQIHLAIVVDEYGGTEGIVTIEDILEELVGEIEDEFDTLDESLYSQDADGGYIVDARMSLIEIESELGISIPQAPQYDTIGGFIVSISGSIPKRGWKVHYDNFFIEVLSADEKSLDKIRIIPIK